MDGLRTFWFSLPFKYSLSHERDYCLIFPVFYTFQIGGALQQPNDNPLSIHVSICREFQYPKMNGEKYCNVQSDRLTSGYGGSFVTVISHMMVFLS